MRCHPSCQDCFSPGTVIRRGPIRVSTPAGPTCRSTNAARSEPASSASSSRRFSFAHVFTSPLQRASKTCELAGFGAVADVDPDLVEWDYGRFEGKLTSEILAERPGWELFRDGCPDGESPRDVAARADGFIARVRGIDGNVLAFSSGHIIRMIAARWLGLPPTDGRFFYCRPASVGVLGFEHNNRDEPIICLWNYVRQAALVAVAEGQRNDERKVPPGPHLSRFPRCALWLRPEFPMRSGASSRRRSPLETWPSLWHRSTRVLRPGTFAIL